VPRPYNPAVPRLLLLLLPTLALAACRSVAAPVPCSGEIEDRSGVFVLYGDTRPRLAAEVWRESSDRERLLVVDAIAAERPDFVLNSGDLVGRGESPWEWARFDAEIAPLQEAGIPYYASLGNHDLSGDDAHALHNFFARFPHLRGRRWYEVRHRALALIVLDTNLRNLDAAQRRDQLEWLHDRLAAAEADPGVRWVMVVTHYPPYTNATLHGPSAWVREHVLGAARTHPKLAAVVAGHVHSYERFAEPLPGGRQLHVLVSGGGGAPLVSLRRDGPFPDLYSGPRSFHYLRVTLSPDQLLLETVMLLPGDRWEVVDTVRVDDAAGSPVHAPESPSRNEPPVERGARHLPPAERP